MAVYFVTGKLGAGKSLVSVSKIRDYLDAGRRVATNLDLYLDEMFTYSKSYATRLPDKPRAEDMYALGDGYDSDDPRDNDESRYGLVVLDECGTWLNSREWNDKGRRDLIDWFLHARKFRWDIIFLIQNIDAGDSQLVSMLCEHLVICRRLDRMRFLRLPLPRLHIANVYYGRNKENFVERWVYKGTDLFHAYDTRQRFRDGIEFLQGGPVDMRAPYTYLSAFHIKGRYMADQPTQWSVRKRLVVFWGGLLVKPILGVLMLIMQPQDFQRTFFFRRHMSTLGKTIDLGSESSCEAPVEQIEASHNDPGVMVALPAPEPNPEPGESAQPPAQDLSIAPVMRSPFTPGFKSF